MDQVRTWQSILDRNWYQIFSPAVATLYKSVRAHTLATVQALDRIHKARRIVEVANLGLHVNVGAELFPILSEDRKEAAAFYTQPSTAELLSHLTLTRDLLLSGEWGNAELLRSRRLADLACGTGTLLRAGYRRLLSFHEHAGGTVASSRRFHQLAIERGVVGADISPIATHLTASSLAELGAGDPYKTSQIGWINVGGPQGRTGSLEYFSNDGLADLFGASGGISSGSEGTDQSVVVVEDRSMIGF